MGIKPTSKVKTSVKSEVIGAVYPLIGELSEANTITFKVYVPSRGICYYNFQLSRRRV